MTRAPRHDARPGAFSLWRCVLSCLVALSIMFAALEPALSDADQGFTCASSVMQQADGDQSHVPSDKAPGQHCAHCGCHQPAQPAAMLVTHADVSAILRFDMVDNDRPVRSTTPPSKPPRT